MSHPAPTEVQERRLAQARRVADGHFLWHPLAYMDDCPLGTIEGGGDAAAMRRYMVVTATDDGEDGWVDLEDTIEAVEERVRGLLHDEWGLVGVFSLDLDREDPTPLKLTVTVGIDMEREEHPDG